MVITFLGVWMVSVTFSGNLYGNLMITGNDKFLSPVGDDLNTWRIKNTFRTAMFVHLALILSW